MAVVPFTLISANALGSGTFTMPTPSGVIRTGTTSGDTLKLQAYDTDTGPAYTGLLTLTAGTTPSMTGLFGFGSAAAPSVAVGAADTGFYYLASPSRISIAFAGTQKMLLNSGVFDIYDNAAEFRLGASADLRIQREAAATLQLGADAAGTTAYTLKGNDRITSDGVGGDLTIAAGRGLGAAGGSLYFQTATTGATGVAGTLTTRLTIAPDGTNTFAGVTNVFNTIVRFTAGAYPQWASGNHSGMELRQGAINYYDFRSGNAYGFNDTNTSASGTVAIRPILYTGAPTLTATNASVTYTDAATWYIGGAPTASTNVTITNPPIALWIDSGLFRYDGPTQTTVGAAGGASALPATPTGYVEINIDGTARVIPYYAKT